MSRRSFPGFDSPAAGFEDPYALLGACHDRVRRTLRLLARLGPHLQRRGADDQAVQAARDVLRYFGMAAPQHHLDEERHLVPLLQASADAALQAAAQTLLADHGRIGQTWHALEPLLERVAAGQVPDPTRFAASVSEFLRLYDAHLVLEETVVFPSARVLQASRGPAAVAEMGQEMALRRLVER